MKRSPVEHSFSVRLVKYGVVGLVSMFAHLTSLFILTEASVLGPVSSSSIGFCISVAVSYYGNAKYTFQSTVPHIVAVPRFLVTSATGFATNAVVMYVGVHVLDLPYPAVQVVALLLIPISNFALHSVWTFRQSSDAPSLKDHIG